MKKKKNKNICIIKKLYYLCNVLTDGLVTISFTLLAPTGAF